MTFTLTYLSTLEDSVSADDLSTLLQQSRTDNIRSGITGLLLLRQRRVMQVLEGAEDQVRSLFRTISNDPRHRDVTTVWTSSAEQRRFPDWSMGFEDLETTENADASLTVTDPKSQPLTPEQHVFIDQRTRLLRRALASGDRLISSLAVILHAHETESHLSAGTIYLRCRECRAHDDPGLDQYPCATASNATWALDAVIRPQY